MCTFAPGTCKAWYSTTYLNKHILVVAQHSVYIAVVVVEPGLDFLCSVVTTLCESVLDVFRRGLVLHVVDLACFWI